MLHKKLPNPDPLPPTPPQEKEKVSGPLQRVATNNNASAGLKTDAENVKEASTNTQEQMHTGPKAVSWKQPISQPNP